MKQRRVAWGLINGVLSLVIVAAGWWSIVHRQDIIDWWRLRNYTPSQQIAQIADQTTMTQRSRDMFYVSDPKIEDRDAFNNDCNTATEQGKVLGCYRTQSIYLFNVTDPRLAGVLQVTAAHETLHAIYDRLDVATRNHVNSLVSAQEALLKNDQHLQDLIALYNKTEPGELDNELHSIFATEYASLTPELEDYYKQYFTNRAQVVSFQKAYNAEFDASKARIESYRKQLDTIKAQIDANTADLAKRNADLNTRNNQLDAMRQSDPAEYNRQAVQYNELVREYNQIARATQALVDQYNAIVAKVKSEVALQDDLNHSLDSKYQPVQAQ